MDPVLQALTGLVLGLSACYFFGMVWLGIRASRDRRAPLSAQARTLYERPGDPIEVTGADPSALDRYHVYYLVPCLNEELVIGATVSFLASAAASASIIVIDDASDDRTSEVALAAGGERAVVVRRELPAARLGKGPALNAGFAELLRLVHARGQDPSQVVVGVMDADGRLSEGALSVVLPLFDDPTVGGAQLAVRIRNRINWVTRFQNFQFWTMSALTQLGRIRTGTVSLGGNGQFTRLSALLELGHQPWNPSLTEDLDLTISLISRGWRSTSTPYASVDQQGVETVKRLLNQRTRWYQGHMTAGRRIPELWRSESITHTTAVESILYLLVPWLLDLPWSILYHLAILRFALHLSEAGFDGGSGGTISLVLLYLVAFYPALLTGVLCRRRDPQINWPQALLLGHSFVAMNYLSWACCWRALYRMVRGRTGWDKTTRAVEDAPHQPATVVRATPPVLAPAAAIASVLAPVAASVSVSPARHDGAEVGRSWIRFPATGQVGGFPGQVPESRRAASGELRAAGRVERSWIRFPALAPSERGAVLEELRASSAADRAAVRFPVVAADERQVLLDRLRAAVASDGAGSPAAHLEQRDLVLSGQRSA